VPVTNDLLRSLLYELENLFSPLARAVDDPDTISSLLRRLGWEIDDLLPDAKTLIGSLRAVTDSLALIRSAIGGGNPNLVGVMGALRETSKIPKAIDELKKQLDAVTASNGVDLSTLPTELVELLFVEWLERRVPIAHSIFVAVGIVEPRRSTELRSTNQRLLRRSVELNRLHFERVPTWISDPNRMARLQFGVDNLAVESDAQAYALRVFPLIAQLVSALSGESVMGRGPGLRRLSDDDEQALAHMLSIRWQPRFSDDDAATIGVNIAAMPVSEGGPGIVLMPYGALSFPISGGGWRGLAELRTLLEAILIKPSEVEFADGSSNELVAGLQITRDGQTYRLGGENETRLELSEVTLTSQLHLTDARRFMDVILAARKAAIFISGGDSDGFLSALLPREPVRIDFDFVLGWSNKIGFHFGGSTSLDVTLPGKLDVLGALTIESINLRLRTSDVGDLPALDAIVAVSVSLALGPLTATVQKIGMVGKLRFPATGGNLGPVNLDVGFKGPDGAGIALASDFVTGGGYLFFDPEKQQYAGVMQLELLNKIAVKAIGLITTRMPDGTKGFSILVILSAEGFPPIQLGLGFTLNGIGGLLGVNRSLQVDTLRAGLKSDALNGILFPRDPIKNATQIVTSLASVFPPTPNRSLFGPMAIIGWGTPTILRLELAIIIEMPDPVRLSILGRLTVALPDEKNPLVRIRMDAIGVVDFDNGEVAIDATLYDSHILSFAITGDMALRLKWGKEPNFVLAIGGFHPRFSPPAQFPSLNRLSLSILDNKNARLRFESYLALTSNTVQFGARVDFYFTDPVVGFTLQGFASFDVLFQLVPFQFVADIGAAVAIRIRGVDLIAIRLAMLLSGPTPWHARGRAEIKILFFSISVAFDLQFGDAIPPPAPEPIDVALLVSSALQDLRNWSSELPADIRHMVTVRVPPAIDVFRVHPLATLSVRQRVAPLFREISRFGSSPISGETTFTVELLSADGQSSLPTPMLTEMFAPAQFDDLTDDDKFTRSSFEAMVAGLRLGSNNFDFESSSAPVEMLMQFETLLVLPDQPSIKQPPYSITSEVLGAAVQFSPAASTAHSQRGASRYAEFTRSPELVE
jgi:hypothetical protein